GAARMAASHYSVMTKETSALFVAGPPIVNALINDRAKHLDRFELGGWEIQTRCGAVDHAADSEEEAFECTRRFLSYLPSSVFEVAPCGPRTDDPDRREEFLFEAIPRDKRKVYKMRPIIDPLCLAIGALGLVAFGGRHRGCLPRGDRRRRRSAEQDRGNRRAVAKAPLALPHGRAVLDRGDHRPARHPQIARRVRRLCREIAPTR